MRAPRWGVLTRVTVIYYLRCSAREALHYMLRSERQHSGCPIACTCLLSAMLANPLRICKSSLYRSSRCITLAGWVSKHCRRKRLQDSTVNIVMEYARLGELATLINERAQSKAFFAEDEIMLW